MRSIASRLGRAPSTISRELRRNGGPAKYRACRADQRAWDKALRPRACRLDQQPALARLVTDKLQLDWSPEQIAGWLRREHPSTPSMRVSHETIYRTIYDPRRKALPLGLREHLRSRRRVRRSRFASNAGQARGQIVDAVSISRRPPEVELREAFGHWEGDLVAGSGNTHVATLVERVSRAAIIVKVPGKNTESVTRAVSNRLSTLHPSLCQSLTWDRGSEMANHKQLSEWTGMPVYFCDPRSPWQRGSNEGTNRLIRQYLPKRTSLARFTQRDLDAIAERLNTRPRKVLDFQCPADVLHAAVALTP